MILDVQEKRGLEKGVRNPTNSEKKNAEGGIQDLLTPFARLCARNGGRGSTVCMSFCRCGTTCSSSPSCNKFSSECSKRRDSRQDVKEDQSGGHRESKLK
jgi:hypothetical protein